MGWLKCDGRLLNKFDYVQLFNMIGFNFGGDNVTNFRLPDPEGRVLGIVGQAVLPDVSGHIWALGDISGEESHQLTIAEIPAHNHDISGGPLNNLNGVVDTAPGNTSVNGDHTHTNNATGVKDPTNNNYHTGLARANGNSTATTVDNLPGGTNDEINLKNTYALTIDSAGNHSHQIASNGGDQRHNNIQPTIWIGNLFIYSGRQWVAATPQSRAIQGANPVPNSNYYRPQGPNINLY